MKRLSRVRETENEHSKPRLGFDFVASEDRVGDLHDMGLLVAIGIYDPRSSHPRFEGTAYVATDRREDLQRSQERLKKLCWEETQASGGPEG